MTLYRLHDSDPGSGMIPVETPREARDWNSQGWGIFHPVQVFRGAVRRQSELTRIRAWAVDLDAGTKEEQWERIRRSPLVPSSVIETKNGYHVYWYAEDARPETYRSLLARIIHRLDADRNASDLCRVLRTPGYWHQKDPSDPFLVTRVHHMPRPVYPEKWMWRCFEETPEEKEKRRRCDDERRSDTQIGGETFWDRVYNLDCLDGLRRLSGTGYVGGEVYQFKRTARGGHNMIIDGKVRSCWVDSDGRIGSKDKGGPTLYQWLRWFGHVPRECVRILKELYPDLEREA